MKNIVIVGGGGHAKVVLSLLKKTGEYEIVGYTDTRDKGELLGVSCIGTDEKLPNLIATKPGCAAVIGIGMLSVHNRRRRLFEHLEQLGFLLPVIISPSAVVNEDVTFGEATVVMDGVIVNTGTRVGKGVVINTNSVVEHDCTICDYVHVAPGATVCGGVEIGSNTLIGAGATVLQYRRIGSSTTIGAGATVVNDCLRSGTYVGTPARIAL